MRNSPMVFRRGDRVEKVDYQMHTVYTDGESTVEDYVEWAEKKGYEEIAITDHVWRSSDWVDEYVEEIREMEDGYGIRVLAGLEAKCIDMDGNVDVSQEDQEKVDFILGVVHCYRPEADDPYDDITKLSAEKAAEVESDLTKKMLHNSTVDVVGHPTRTYYKFHYGETTEEEFSYELLEEMVAESVGTDKPLEYNARLPERVKKKLLDLYLDKNSPFTIGSDSHTVERLKNLDHEAIRKKVLNYQKEKE